MNKNTSDSWQSIQQSHLVTADHTGSCEKIVLSQRFYLKQHLEQTQRLQIFYLYRRLDVVVTELSNCKNNLRAISKAEMIQILPVSWLLSASISC